MPKLPKSKGLSWKTKAKNPFFVSKNSKKDYTTKNTKFYNSKEWKALRNYHINEYPLCKWCEEEGHTVKADIVDHIIEIVDGGEKLNQDNLMSLCHRHHIQKSNWERNKRKKRR
jgi:5-methylcytosine-specific restriction endonuclease McrA